MTFNPNLPPSQSNPMPVNNVVGASGAGLSSRNIVTAASTLVKTGAGQFYGLSINTGGAGSSAKVYDGVDNSGVVLGTYGTAAQNVINLPGLAYATGLFVVTSGGTPADITVLYL